MKSFNTPCCYFCLLVWLCNTGCQSKKPEPNQELNSIDLLRGEITFCGVEQFGAVHFPSSCNDSTQKKFDLAISLLHSFEYAEAEKAFVKVIDADPHCVMAYWGVAMSNFHPLWEPPNRAELEKGAKIIKAAEALPRTPREQDYLDAIGAFYKDWDKVDHKSRTLRFEKKMQAVYEQYRDDTEAAVFYALSLIASADPTDKTYHHQKKAGKILEAIFTQQPNHPGVAHYIIHNYDNPELAALALPTARRYASIAPASAHAQHMPSHIFTRLGLWEESISTNLNSISSAQCYAERSNMDGHWDEELHGMDYLVYAYLQVGDNRHAKEQLDYLQTFTRVSPVNFKVAYATAAIPARIVLENKRWAEAAHLQLPSVEIPWNKFPWQKSILHYARAIGSSHVGDIHSAERELAILNSLYQQLTREGDGYKANQVLIQIKTADAWLHFARGDADKAIALMKAAANMEDSTEKHPVTPGEVLPARELLGDLFLELNDPSPALAAYEMDLKRHPNRFNGLCGAARAARQTGNRKKAAMYFEMLLQQAAPSNDERPELTEARKFVASI